MAGAFWNEPVLLIPQRPHHEAARQYYHHLRALIAILKLLSGLRQRSQSSTSTPFAAPRPDQFANRQWCARGERGAVLMAGIRKRSQEETKPSLIRVSYQRPPEPPAEQL